MCAQLTEKAVKDIAEQFDLTEHHAFALWVLSAFHYESDLSETTLTDIYSQTYELLQDGGAGDSCLDGYFYDESDDALYLYQIKDSSSKCGIQEAREVALALNYLHSDLHSPVSNGTSREQVVSMLRRVIENEGRVILRAVNKGGWT